MTEQLNLMAAAPTILHNWQRAATALAKDCSFGRGLAELVFLRASQINGCANCINLHATEAREAGETEQRIYLLAAWRDAPCYDDRERAALEWTEVMTRLSDRPMIDRALEGLRSQFSDEECVKLTILINIITGWNRIAVGFGLFADPVAIRARVADLDKAERELA